MSAIQTNDTIAVRRLTEAGELSAAVETEALRAMGMNLSDAHSVWATTGGTVVAVLFPGDPLEDMGGDGCGEAAAGGGEGGWIDVLRGPVRCVGGGGELAAPGPVAGPGPEAAEYDAPGEHAVRLVETIRAEAGIPVAGMTIPRSAALAPALDRWRLTTGVDWDLMVCHTPPPPQPGEALVRPGLADAEVQAFLDRVNPHHSVRTGDPTVELWAGVRGDQGELLAVGALTRNKTGVGYLASIATDPAARGAGRGSAVAAYLTRQVLEAGEPRCTLAHYHPNESARRIYLRLGYRTMTQNHSVSFG